MKYSKTLMITLVLTIAMVFSGTIQSEELPQYQAVQTVETQNDVSNGNTLTPKQRRAVQFCDGYVQYADEVYKARQRGASLDQILTNLDDKVGSRYGQNNATLRLMKKTAISIYGNLSHVPRNKLLVGLYTGCLQRMSQ